jgi:hypothetical protein
MSSRMCRRRGSAIALNGSEVVEARGTGYIYIPIWAYVKCGFSAIPRASGDAPAPSSANQLAFAAAAVF